MTFESDTSVRMIFQSSEDAAIFGELLKELVFGGRKIDFELISENVYQTLIETQKVFSLNSTQSV